MRYRRDKNISEKIWIVLLIFILILLPYLIFKSGLLDIENIEVIAQNLDCANIQGIIDSSQIKNKNFFLTDGGKVATNIKDKFICVKNVKVSRIFPNSAKLEITPRQPQVKLLALKLNEASPSYDLENMATPSAEPAADLYLIDSEGVIFAKNRSGENIPSIFTTDFNLVLGERLKGERLAVLQILDKLKSFRVQVITTQIVDNNFVIFSKPKIIFRLDDKIDTQIASLQLILEKAKIDAEELVFIDLRFDKPIIRLAPKKK